MPLLFLKTTVIEKVIKNGVIYSRFPKDKSADTATNLLIFCYRIRRVNFYLMFSGIGYATRTVFDYSYGSLLHLLTSLSPCAGA